MVITRDDDVFKEKATELCFSVYSQEDNSWKGTKNSCWSHNEQSMCAMVIMVMLHKIQKEINGRIDDIYANKVGAMHPANGTASPPMGLWDPQVSHLVEILILKSQHMGISNGQIILES